MAVLSFLELLSSDAPLALFDEPIEAARRAGADAAVLTELDLAKALALRVKRRLEASRRREAELSALYDTAGDLAARTDLDAVLKAIVRRARQLLSCDLAYMTLTDEVRGDSYTTITDGGASVLFETIRVPMGEGIAGLVAETAVPYAAASYFDDRKIWHTPTTDGAVRAEGIVSLAGVPLTLDDRVIGVLLAANRTERPFSAADVALMASLATHAAIAIDKARLFRKVEDGLTELRIAGDLLKARTESVERAAAAHERFSAIVLEGGDIEDVARGLGELLGGEVVIMEQDGSLLSATSSEAIQSASVEASELLVGDRARTRLSDGVCAAPVVAGTDTLGTLFFLRDEPMDDADMRIVERAALVTALLILFRRSLAAGEEKRRGELLEDVLIGRATEGLRERARLLGANLESPHAVVVVEIKGDRGRLAQAAAHLTGARRGLSTVIEGHLAVVMPDLSSLDAAHQVWERLRQIAGGDLTVGAAGPACGADEIRDAYAEAAKCMQALVALGRPGQVARMEDLGFIGLLLARDRDAGTFISSVLGPLLEYDVAHGTSLELTLGTYFNHAGNTNRTAAALHIHPKTVTQRLDRVGQLLGADWNSATNRLQLQLALHLRQVIHGVDAATATRTEGAPLRRPTG